MRVLILSNGEIKEKKIKNTLEDLQQTVGGYIETPRISRVFNENEIDVIINEEGKFIDGLKPEIAVIKRGTNAVLDIIYGNCIFASHDQEGNTIALSDEQIKIVAEELKMDVVLHSRKEDKDILIKALFI